MPAFHPPRSPGAGGNDPDEAGCTGFTARDSGQGPWMIVLLALVGWVALAVLLAPVIGRVIAVADGHRPPARRAPAVAVPRPRQPVPLR